MVVGRVDPTEAYSRLADYQFNIIVSDPFWLARLTEIAREQGKPAPIKLMIGGGEGISDRTRSEIEEFWGAPLYMTYASAEAATTLGFECPARRGYHVNEFDFFVEIDRPDPEGYGELVITTITRRVMPLIRYRTGDVARWLEGRCDCGLPFRRISPICGRVDEQVSCAWGNVYPDFFETILSPVPGLADDWQVAVCERSGKQTFEFRLEVQNGISHQEIKDRIFNLIKSEHPSAWQTYVQKLADVEFNFFPSGSLRTGRKLLRLVDERQTS
jgi:phenylacetate-CoA ligase